jgi:hypothetical protein
MAKSKGGKVKEQKSEAQKRADFKEQAAKRVNAILRQFGALGRLARPGKYSWDDADLKKMQTALDAAGTDAFAAFSGKKAPSDFTL